MLVVGLFGVLVRHSLRGVLTICSDHESVSIELLRRRQKLGPSSNLNHCYLSPPVRNFVLAICPRSITSNVARYSLGAVPSGRRTALREDLPLTNAKPILILRAFAWFGKVPSHDSQEKGKSGRSLKRTQMVDQSQSRRRDSCAILAMSIGAEIT